MIFSLLKHGHSSQFCGETLHKFVYSSRHSCKFGRFRAYHFHQLRHISMRYGAEFVQSFHATENVLFGRFALKELQNCHRQFATDVVENLKNKFTR